MREGSRQSPEELGQERDTDLLDHPGRDRTVDEHRGLFRDTESFSLYIEQVLAPRLKRGQIVIMDNLSVHTSKWVRELIEERGCKLWLLPSYSPDFNPIEEAFSKVKGLLRRAGARRTLQALFEATAEAIRAVSAVKIPEATLGIVDT